MARERGAGGPPLTAAVIRDVIAAADGVCTYCRLTCAHLQVDHVVALASGGSNERSNLVAACGRCNRVKGDRGLPYLLTHMTSQPAAA
jgi:5-methylcytosine-specific restriction endonuclease McrA